MRVYQGLKILKGFKREASLGDNIFAKTISRRLTHMKSYQKVCTKFFDESRQLFEDICAHLIAHESYTESEAEAYLQIEGFDLLRHILQDYLSFRSAEEDPAEKVIGPDLIERKANRQHIRYLETVFGPVMIKRKAYSAPGVPSLYPLDKALNLPLNKYSYSLQAHVCSEAGLRSFDEALREMEAVVAGHVPKRQAEQMVAEASRDFESYYAQSKLDMLEETGSILVTSMDSKGIAMRSEDLNAQHYSKRMAVVSAVYSIAPFVRAPTEIIASLYPGKTKPKEQRERPKPQHKKVWARLESSVEDVVRHCFTEARKHDPEGQKRWVSLVDGNLTQQKYLKRVAKKQGIALTIILDFIHVAGYVWDAAKALGLEKAELWVQDKLLKILQGQSSLVAASIRRMATCKNLSGSVRKEADTCANYLLNQKAYMRYDQYLRQGYPIATGVIEGACRYLVKDRMDRTGSRWRIPGAEAVLKMRALKTNDDFKNYWDYHQSQAFERNYAAIKVFSKQGRFPLNTDYEMAYAV